ncbi:MAG: hypothetical protein ABSF94_05660 [Steroidobacteraceae bacterium]
MRAAVEISMYPLAGEYRPLIRAFIDRLKPHKDLVVRTNSLSTQIWGELDQLMRVLSDEISRSASGGPQLVFVLKVLPGLAPPADLVPSDPA